MSDLLENEFEKDPNAVLDYTVDWTAWLGSDTIATSAWTVPSGITKDADTNTTKKTTIWLSGGSVNKTYEITNRITTAGSRTDDRSIKVIMKEK